MATSNDSFTTLSVDDQKAEAGKEEDEPEHEMLFKSCSDSQGRRSMTLRRLDTGAEIAWADEFYEKEFAGPGENAVMRLAFRRLDQTVCWFMLEGWRPGLLTNTVQWLCLPILALKLAFDHLRMRCGLFWERRRRVPLEKH